MLGRLRRGLVSLSAVVSERDAKEVRQLKDEEGYRTEAAACGAIVSGWAERQRLERRRTGSMPRSGSVAAGGSVGPSNGLEFAESPVHGEGEPEDVRLEPWEEVEGRILAIDTTAGEHVLDIRTMSARLVRLRVPGNTQTDLPPSKQRLPALGDLIGVLRTDLEDRPYVLRFLGVPRGPPSDDP